MAFSHASWCSYGALGTPKPLPICEGLALPTHAHTTCRAVLPSVAVLADAEPVLAEPAAAAGVGAVQPPAVLPGVALLADARAVDALSLPRAVAGTPQLGAVLSGEALLTDALPVHAEPVGAAAGGAAELGAVLAPVVVVADALALQAHATAGAAAGAAGLGAVAARPALHADAAAGLQAEVPVAAALRGVIQMPCKEVGPRVRAHPVGCGKKVSIDGLWGKGARCGVSRGWSFLWVRTPSSGELVALGAELGIWAHGGAWGLPRSFFMAMGSISFIGVQVLCLVFLQISTQLMGTSLLLGRSPPWPSPLHQPCLLLSPLHPLL